MWISNRSQTDLKPTRNRPDEYIYISIHIIYIYICAYVYYTYRVYYFFICNINQKANIVIQYDLSNGLNYCAKVGDARHFCGRKQCSGLWTYVQRSPPLQMSARMLFPREDDPGAYLSVWLSSHHTLAVQTAQEETAGQK